MVPADLEFPRLYHGEPLRGLQAKARKNGETEDVYRGGTGYNVAAIGAFAPRDPAPDSSMRSVVATSEMEEERMKRGRKVLVGSAFLTLLFVLAVA